VLAVLVVGVPIALVATIGNPIPDRWTWTEPLSTPALLGVLALVAWVLWAQLIVCVVVEVVAEVRLATGRSADWLARVPGTFGGQQALARTLVHAVVAIGITTTVANGAAPLLARAHVDAGALATPAHPVAITQAADITHAPKHRATTEITVQRGDSLWSIAEQRLGAGDRWREIATLNAGRTMDDGTVFHDAATIQPGWILLVPDEVASSAHTVSVRPGDTLWGLAEQEYGGGEDWQRIYRANETVIDDPHWIYPGEQLTIPPTRSAGSHDPTEASHPRQHRQPDTEQRNDGPPPTDRTEAGPPPAQVPTVPTKLPPATVDVDPASDHGSDATVIAVRAFTGAGAMLAAFLLAAYVARRRGQMRQRRSGRVIRATRPQHVGMEQALRTTGPTAGDDIEVVDQALRSLGGIAGGPPDLAAARLDQRVFVIHLREPRQNAPEPWRASSDGDHWTVARDDIDRQQFGPAPYPMMVTIGSDSDGGTWFIDLEAAGIVTFAGPVDACVDAIRFVTAELAANRWSDTAHLTCIGIERELASVDPDRIEFLSAVDLDVLLKKATRIGEIRETNGIGVLEGRTNVHLGDNWTPVVMLSTDILTAGDHLAPLHERLVDRRSAVAFVGIAGDSTAPGLAIAIDSDGCADIGWATGVRVNRLSAEEAVAIGSAFADLDGDDEPPPIDETSECGLNAGLADALGALRVELRDQRQDGGGPRSLLPGEDAHYVEAAATTREDLVVLAPPVREEAAAGAQDHDPELDADVAAWFDPASAVPKLRVLGPLELTVSRPLPDRAKNRTAYLTELCAYLAHHPAGRTAQQLAAAFSVQPATIHKRIEELRLWLGEDPATGDHRVPEAKLSAPGTARGVGNYVVTGMAHDADLFRRLRIRAQLRGSEGIDDLVTALRLVSGEPFDQQRASGYGWLGESGDDYHLAAAIVDVAHVVATSALASGQPERAAWAASQAILASPYEDKPRLDFAAAQTALGRQKDAEAYLADQILNRSDDGLAPPDPTPRTAQVTRDQWV
jgi:LysM repeat protein